MPSVVTDHAGLGAGSVTAGSHLFRALGDPARLAILQRLAAGEQRVCDLTAHLGLAQSTVSAHLACLRGCGLVTSEPHGRSSVFTLAAAPELLELLRSAERLLAATGDAVVLCPSSGQASGAAGTR